MKVFSYGLLLSVALGAFTSCATKPVTAPEVAAVDTVEEDTDSVFGRIPSAECDNGRWKECKQARSNDYAKRYMIDYNGNLFRRINGQDCQISNGVTDIKISQHPNDVAVAYFKKDSDLYIMNLDREYRPGGQCPSAKGNFKLLMKSVRKFTVTSNINSTIVNSALDSSGNFYSWDNRVVVYQDRGIDQFKMNDCFKVKGKSFSSYVLFTRDYSGNVTKVKMSGNGYAKDASKVDARRYNSVSDFEAQNNVCK